MSALSPAVPGTARPGLTVPGLLVASGAVKAKATAAVTDPRDGTHSVS